MSKRVFIWFAILVLVLAVAIPWLVFRAKGDAANGEQQVASDLKHGQSLFQTNCGTCHTLYAAGTDGNYAPNLDELLAPQGPAEGEEVKSIEGRVLNFAITGRGQDDIRFAPMLADKLGYLASEVGGSDFAPTTQQQQVFDELTKQELAFENDLDLFLNKDVVAFNNLLKERNASYIMVNPRKEKRAVGAAK